jgi:hypothetical protein
MMMIILIIIIMIINCYEHIPKTVETCQRGKINILWYQ